MRCRRIIGKNIVWFGSQGVDTEGKKISSVNYSDAQTAVRDSLTQRLSVIKGELWFNLLSGIPLLDEKSPSILDSYISKTILEHPDVISIENFDREIIQHKYSCKFSVKTRFGELEMSYNY